VNRRIRKKLLAQYDALIANSLHIYVTRPRGDVYEDLGRGMLSISVGLALNGRFLLMPGPRHGWGVAPPEDFTVEWAHSKCLVAKAVLRLFPPGNAPDVFELLHFTAEYGPKGWRHVLLTFTSRDVTSGPAEERPSSDRTRAP
jgi:hypothetical protein